MTGVTAHPPTSASIAVPVDLRLLPLLDDGHPLPLEFSLPLPLSRYRSRLGGQSK
jgi:hypothetical protein